jgi:hypothetical protein
VLAPQSLPALRHSAGLPLMGSKSQMPFAGRELSWRERREANRRMNDRAAARAEAMPPPDPSTRVALTGGPTSSPGATRSEPASTGAEVGPVAARLNPQQGRSHPVQSHPVQSHPVRSHPLPPEPLLPGPAVPGAPATAQQPAPERWTPGGHSTEGKHPHGPGYAARSDQIGILDDDADDDGIEDPYAAWLGHPETVVSSATGAPVDVSDWVDADLVDQPAPVDPWRVHRASGARRTATRSRVFGPLLGPWPAKVANPGIVLAALGVLAGVCVGVGAGLPVLTHPFRATPTVWAAAAVLAAAAVAARSWGSARRRLRRFAVVIVALLLGALLVGVLTNPVVVGGHVYLSTSRQARDYRQLISIRNDLYTVADTDRYLTYDDADAGAHFNEYPTVTAQLEAMSNHYVLLSESPQQLPDARFEQTITDTKAAVYWAFEAMTLKQQLLTQEDTQTEADLATDRAEFAQALLAAGHDLNLLASELDLPLSSTGPHE